MIYLKVSYSDLCDPTHLGNFHLFYAHKEQQQQHNRPVYQFDFTQFLWLMRPTALIKFGQVWSYSEQ